MKRISFTFSYLSMLMFSAVPTWAEVLSERPRPNILWLTFEDTSPQFIGCYGDSFAKTPTMDQLASEGVRFTSAFSTGTVSSPSRFCLITGVTPAMTGTGNHRSQYPIPEFIHGFPKYLRDSGYYTSNNSKTDYNNAREKEMIAESWDESSGKAGWWNRKPGQPFFAVFNSPHSHQSRTMTNPWEYYEKQVLDHLESSRVTKENAAFDMPPFYRNTIDMRRQMSRVYNSISLVDQQFESILQRLDKDGLRDSTIIFCFSDHGEGIPRGKGSSLGLGYRVPCIVWIPEMYKDLSPWGEGVVTDHLISFEDFGATVLALASVDIPDYIEGKPFMGKNPAKEKKYVYGACDGLDSNNELSRSVTDGEYIYTRVFTCHQPFVRWMSYFDHAEIQQLMRCDYGLGILNEFQRNVMEPREPEYLYDLRRDKWEVMNLAKDPQYEKVLKRFRKAMEKRILDTRDAHFIPEYSYAAYSDVYIPYDLRLNKDFYPVRRVLHAALLNGYGKDVILEQINLLQDKNPLVQYWAALGLFISRLDLESYISQLKKVLLKIDYKPAQLYLAGALFDCVEDDVSCTILEEGMLSDDVNVNKQTMQILLNIDIDKAKRILPVIHKHIQLYKNSQKHIEVEYFMNVVLLRLENKRYRFSSFW